MTRGRLARGALALGLTLGFLLPAAAGAQPGMSGPLEGRVQSFYFDVLGYTEVWVDIAPPSRDTGPSPVSLNLTLRYKGRPVEQPASATILAVVVRAKSNDLVNPNMIRQQILTLLADGVPLWDPALRPNFYYLGGPCDRCVADTVDITVPPQVLDALATARTVTGNAMGFEFTLSEANLDAIKTFVRAVRPGAV